MSPLDPEAFIASQLKAADDTIDRALTLVGEAAGWCGTRNPSYPLAACVLQPHDDETYHDAIAPEIGGARVQWRDTAYIHPREVASGEVDPDEQHDQAKESADRWEPKGFES